MAQNIDLLEKIYNKVEGLSEDMTDMKVISAQNTASLEEHMRRTDLLEEQVTQVRGEIAPLRKHVDMMGGMFKFIGIMGTGAGIAKVILTLMGY